jgi:hypothetical protein
MNGRKRTPTLAEGRRELESRIPDGLHVSWRHNRPPSLKALQAIADITGNYPDAFATQMMGYCGPWEPNGGETICLLYNEQGDPVAKGVARCSPKDPYNKAVGRIKSLSRALKSLENDGVAFGPDVSR